MAPILIAKGATDLLLLPQMANRRGLIAGATGTLRESANQADKIRKVLYDAGRWYRQNLPRAHKHIRRPVSHIEVAFCIVSIAPSVKNFDEMPANETISR